MLQDRDDSQSTVAAGGITTFGQCGVKPIMMLNSKTEMNGCFPQGPVFATAGPLWPLLLVRVVRLGAKRAITHS
jgi:hypothetical protein